MLKSDRGYTYIKYEFNRNEFVWAEEFYDIIQKKMNLPEWFGKNGDACGICSHDTLKHLVKLL